MAVIHPDAFKNSPSAGFDGLFDWDFLKPAFAPTRIEPMDLDAVIERRGWFLCFETKNGIKPIPGGQVITLTALVQTGKWTVIVLREKRPQDIDGWDVWYRGRASGEVQKRYEHGDADALVEFTRRWFEKASHGGWKIGEAA